MASVAGRPVDSQFQNMNDNDVPHHNVIREMLETERKYIQDLETMQKFSIAVSHANIVSNALSQINIMDKDTVQLLFPTLDRLVNFHRIFLSRLEFTARLPLKVQRWGQQFIECEEEFSVYEYYCLNYKKATEIMLSNERTRAVVNHIIDVKHELPMLLLKPIQRVCQYPLLLDSLAKALSNQGYEHHDELIRGSEVAKRVLDRINEAQRREENQEVFRNLKTRVQNWKGHQPENFGDLLLHGVFVVHRRSDACERAYVTFLFRTIILFFRNDHPAPSQRRGSKKKQLSLEERLAISSTIGSTPLIMIGRILMSNVVSALPMTVSANSPSHSSDPSQYNLKITWRGEDDLDSFIIQFNRQEEMKQWKDCITTIIQSQNSLSTPSRPEASSNNSSETRSEPREFDAVPTSPNRSSTASISTYVPHRQEDCNGQVIDSDSEIETHLDDMEFLSDEDDLEDYPAPSYPPSGRDTPVEHRALTRSRSLPSRFKSKGDAASSRRGQPTPRARSNSLPAACSMLIFSNATKTPSNNERTPPPPQPPQTANSRSRTPITQNLSQSPGRTSATPRPVNLKLKVHYKDDLFLLLVPQTISYEDLIKKMKQKIQLCGYLPDGPLKVKYKDEDGDLVSLVSTEDVELVLDQLRPGKQAYALFYVS